ncbi:MAG: diacylglycerol kinase [Devosia sp.]|nr:diacylglycerol kinase [Devosia sp.]
MSAAIAMIAAVARNGVIGSAQSIPWRIPSDFAFFKRTTMGKPMIMGRKQFETVGKPLPGRTNIVVTRQAGFAPAGVLVVSSLAAALAQAQRIAEGDGAGGITDVGGAAEIASARGSAEIMVIGGGEIYRQLMDRADRLYISHVELAPEGDVLFPAIDPAIWRVVDEPAIEPSPKDEAAYRVKVYERR